MLEKGCWVEKTLREDIKGGSKKKILMEFANLWHMGVYLQNLLKVQLILHATPSNLNINCMGPYHYH